MRGNARGSTCVRWPACVRVLAFVCLRASRTEGSPSVSISVGLGTTGDMCKREYNAQIARHAPRPPPPRRAYPAT